VQYLPDVHAATDADADVSVPPHAAADPDADADLYLPDTDADAIEPGAGAAHPDGNADADPHHVGGGHGYVHPVGHDQRQFVGSPDGWRQHRRWRQPRRRR
jgi:hypothetical protein